MEMHRFGSCLYGESKDRDVVIIAEVPSGLLVSEDIDLHVIHSETYEPVYPENAKKMPELLERSGVSKKPIDCIEVM